ncbi:MAG: carboxypeptidase-like regulatory domain-containing protein, partial [Taibaiella sp.]
MSRLLQLLFILLLIPAISKAGDIKGHITEPGTGEPAVGAVIALLEKPEFNAIAGLDGSFQLKQVPTGTYTLKVTYMGAHLFTQLVTIIEEQDLTPNIHLEPENGKQLGEIVVSGKKDGGSENTARNLEQKADQVMNIVSARAIQVSPDLTVA